MIEDFFNWIDIDQISFWIGFLTGAVFLWVLRRARPTLRLAGRLAVDRFLSVRDRLTTSTEIRLRADVLNYVQKRHLAQVLCALDEMVIAPKIIFPAPQIEPDYESPEIETVEGLIPFLPDFPAFGAAFAYPAQPISKVFQRGADILLLGSAGTGKTVALAYLASQLARGDAALANLSGHLPLFIDAVDLIGLHREQTSAFDLCYAVVSRYASTMTQARLSQVLKKALQSGSAFLIIDSVDELPPEQVQTVCQWLRELLSKYPENRVIVAAAPANHADLMALNLQPAGLSGWSQNEKRDLFSYWQSFWQEIVHNQPLNPFNAIDPIILENWLANSPHTETPFSFTLRLWALFAGDLLGPDDLTSMEAYIRRCIQDQPESRKFLSKYANRLIQDKKPALQRSELQKLASDTIPVPAVEVEEGSEESEGQSAQGKYVSPSNRMINDLVAAGIFREVAGDAVTFSNVLLAAYMMCEQFLDPAEIANLLDQPRWESRQQCLRLLAATQDLSASIPNYLDQEDAPLENNLIEAGQWLQFAHRSNKWTEQALRLLAGQLQNNARSLAFRFRIVAVLAACDDKSTDVLFRKMLTQYDAETRLFGCFGCGLQQDIKALPELKTLLADPDPGVRKSACLALGAIGGPQAVEAIAVGLLQNDEALQKCAAEMLATDSVEGYETLREGSEFDDLLVRRAVVHGLKKVDSVWSRELLAQIQLEDHQWVVRNAAEEALNQLNSLSPAIPSPLPELMNTPWIIEYASEQGLGIASDEAAIDMLIHALEHGNEDQKTSALHRLPFLERISPGAFAAIYSVYYGSRGANRESAYLALLLLSGRQVQFPEPLEFGFY